MKLRVIPTGAFQVNTFVVPAGAAGAIVVDPGEAKPILETLERGDSAVCAIVLTHGHVDHLAGMADLLRRYPAPVYLHPADAAWAFSPLNCLPPYYPHPPARPADVRPLREGELRLGETVWRVIETPGHTPGGVCLHDAAARCLISGDTLFREGVGRTDLPGGDADLLARSLRRLLELPDDIVVWPGHGPSTTLGHERRRNPFIGSV